MNLAGDASTPAQPSASLVLLKATGKVAHQGGLRFRAADREYQVLRDWIAAGCPPSPPLLPRLQTLRVTPSEAVVLAPSDAVALRATAVFDDGVERDVTDLMTCETSNLTAHVDAAGFVRRTGFGETTIIVRYLDQQTPVRVAFIPERPAISDDPFAPRVSLDRLWLDRWRRLRVRPAPIADDATLVRRLFLDLLGVLPTGDEAREFVGDQAVDKWERRVDRLLARPEFADRWALAWSDVLRVEEKMLDTKGVERFHGWIRESLNRGQPLDRFVRELVTSQGSTYDVPPANFYRALRDPVTRGETVGRLFLGVRLQCAQCHNHPFDRWTQDDYYQWAALFVRVDYQIVENQRKDKLDQHEFVGDQIVRILDVGEVRNPRTGRDAVPRFLGADTPEMEPNSDRREPLGDWLTSRANDAFARSQVNFIWYHVFGRGLVEPVDDLRPTNPARIPKCWTVWRATSRGPISTCEVWYALWSTRNSIDWPPNPTRRTATTMRSSRGPSSDVYRPRCSWMPNPRCSTCPSRSAAIRDVCAGQLPGVRRRGTAIGRWAREIDSWRPSASRSDFWPAPANAPTRRR